MAKITINGVVVEAVEGSPVIAAADEAGINIPRFCYHPDLRPAGNCRICQVEIEGNPKLAVSCMTPVKDGMVVRSDTEKVAKAVRADLEMLLLNHPVDCPICDQAGECYLQDFYMQVGLHESRIPLADKVRKRKVVDLGPMIVLDSERCVLCSRCIRFSDDVSKTSQFGFFNRGSHMEIGTFHDRPLADPYSGCYADVCPVGALTSKDFRFKSRVWFLERTDSVCPECSTGCNLRIDHKDGRAYRFVPRRNPEVNQSWMCDEGRSSSAALADPGRLVEPAARDREALVAVGWEQALANLAALLTDAVRVAGPDSVVALATPRATCEELWLFRKLMRERLGVVSLDFRVDPDTARVSEREDEVLRRRDHNPNTRGAELLDFVPGPGGHEVEEALRRAAAGEVRVLYLLGPGLLERWPDTDLVRRALAGAGTVVLHDTHARPMHADVDLLLPVAAIAESEGTLVNHAYRLQRVRRAIRPPGSARTGLEVLAGLGRVLGMEGMPASPREAFRALAAEVAVFGGLTPERIGPLGVALDPSVGGGR